MCCRIVSHPPNEPDGIHTEADGHGRRSASGLTEAVSEGALEWQWGAILPEPERLFWLGRHVGAPSGPEV